MRARPVSRPGFPPRWQNVVPVRAFLLRRQGAAETGFAAYFVGRVALCGVKLGARFRPAAFRLYSECGL